MDYNLFSHNDSSDHKTTFAAIHRIEENRRRVLTQVQWPFLRVLTAWNGTCLRSIVFDWLVWLCIVIFVGVRIRARSGAEDPAMREQLINTNLDVIGGFLSFFLVLFVNGTNTRFFEMYLLSKKCAGQIQDVAGLASVSLPLNQAKRLVRYLNAAHIAGYVGLSDTYQKENLFDHFNEKHHLLEDKEVAHLKQYDMNAGSGTFKELCTWCQKEIHQAKAAGHLDTIESNRLHQHVLALRASMDGLYDYCDQPIHFFYMHFLCLLTAFYLPLFALDNAFACGWGETSWQIEALTGLTVVLQAFFVVGLRVLGQAMIDPYGDDIEDLSVITYVATTWENCQIILAAELPPMIQE